MKSQNDKNGFELVLSRYPSKSAMGRAVGVTCAAVRYWESKGAIPIDFCLRYETALGIPREQIRPDLFRRSRR